MPVDPAQLRIVQYPYSTLRTKADPVDAESEEVHAVAGRMIELMHEAEGVGLAAPQVGLPWRVFVTHVIEPPDGDRVFINPTVEIIDRASSVHEEGCLSLPGIHGDIRRPVGIRITATDLEGNPFTLEDHDFRSRVWQHELDHLNGVLIIDKMMPKDRLASRRAIRELEHAAGD